MKKRFLQYTLLSCSLMLLFSACRKDSFKGTETKQTGKTFVYITEANGDPYVQYFDVFSDVKPVVLFTVRRDAANTADLQKAITITLTADADSTDALGLTPFTTDLYTPPSAADLSAGGLYASSKGVTISPDGKTITVNFAAGEFNKNVIYKIDGSKLDLTQTYGAVYKISNPGGFTVQVGYAAVGAGIAVKNQYDGVYSVTGTIQRYVAGGDAEVGSYNGTIVDGKTTDVITNGPTSDSFNVYWADGSGVGGIDGLQFSVNPTTNHVTVTCATNPNVVDIDGQENSYDPATKTFTLNFKWYGVGGDVPPVGSSRQAHVILTYTGPR